MATAKPTKTTSDRRLHGIIKGYRSGLEEKLAKQLQEAGVESDYESLTITYEVPASTHKYTPDFPLPNGIIVESKGLFDADDRKKHLLVKQQHPHLDIRFVFSRSSAPIYKGSKTTYGDWCRKNGFLFSDKLIPEAWLKEKPLKKDKP